MSMQTHSTAVAALREAPQAAGTPPKLTSLLQSRVQPATVMLGALGFLTWVALLAFPTFTAGRDLDQSWAQAYAYFLTHRFQAGVDYIFTFGPLGYFYTQAYDANLYWPAIVWQLTFKLLLSANLFRISGRFHSSGFRAAFRAATIIVLPCAAAQDCQYCLLIVSAGLLLMDGMRLSRANFVINLAALAIVSQVKYTFMALSAATVLLVAWNHFAERRARAIGAIGIFVSVWVLGWIAAGQSIANIPAYFRSSLSVASGYVSAMSISGDQLQLMVGWACLLFGLVAIALTWKGSGRAPLASIILLAAAYALAWKQGFVRQDSIHTNLFFVQAFFLSFMTTVMVPTPRKTQFAVATLSGSLCLAGVIISAGGGSIFLDRLARGVPSNLLAIQSPVRERARLESARLKLGADCALPKIAAIVGSEKVDLFSFQQGALFLNGLNYRPRPVFQSYCASSSSLAEANARYLGGERAPKYLLYNIETIDDRVPSLDDSRALLEVLWRYKPVTSENGYTLMVKDPAAPKGRPSRHTVLTRTIRFGEELRIGDLPGRYNVVFIDLKSTLAGKLRSAALRPSEVSIILTTESGSSLKYRLIPEMASSGFLLNPFLQRTGDVLDLYKHKAKMRVKSFRLICVEGQLRSYKDEIEVRIEALPDLTVRRE